MMNLDIATLSADLEAALEAHANVLRLQARAEAAGAAYTVAYKAHVALPAHSRLLREVCEASEAYDRAVALTDEAEAVLAAACEKAGIESL